MTLGSCLRHSSHQNPLPINFVNNKLVDTFLEAFTKSNGSPTPTFWAFSCASIQGSALDVAASIPAALPFTKKLFEQFIQTCIEKVSNQTLILLAKKTLDRSLKARNPELYFKNSYIKCYYFCRQFEDYFKTVKAKGHKYIFFIVLLLQDRINSR